MQEHGEGVNAVLGIAMESIFWGGDLNNLLGKLHQSLFCYKLTRPVMIFVRFVTHPSVHTGF